MRRGRGSGVRDLVIRSTRGPAKLVHPGFDERVGLHSRHPPRLHSETTEDCLSARRTNMHRLQDLTRQDDLRRSRSDRRMSLVEQLPLQASSKIEARELLESKARPRMDANA